MPAQTPWLDVPHIQPPADVAQPPADAVHTSHSSGSLASRVLSPGSGRSRPAARDVVTVAYTAWTADGTTIDASSFRGSPSRWAIDQVMDGLRLGLQLMVTGEKRRLWIPREMAHDWATTTLVFDVELIDIEPSPTRRRARTLAAHPPTRHGRGAASATRYCGREAEPSAQSR